MTTAARLVILGATGDLTGRYLLPALAHLAVAEHLPERLEVLGVARDDWDTGRFREHALSRLRRHAANVDGAAAERVVGRFGYRPGDVTDPAVLDACVEGAGGPVVVYLALPPSLFAPVVAGLAGSRLPTGSRIVVEKPFGTDLDSAASLNDLLHRSFPEEAVFRMDHFLGKQTVQNVLGLRFANRLFDPLWCAEHVERVDIVWDETVALEGRAGYYDHAGALRDMVQNHLLQLLCLVAMERPSGLGERPLRDAKVAVLRQVRRLTADEVAGQSVRARYAAGRIGDRAVPAYVQEPGVDGDRRTETFAEVTLFVDSHRWRGVPFRLRSGKALGMDSREIRLQLRPLERLPFGQPDEVGPNVITLSMDPDRLAADIALNGAGEPFCLDPARLEVVLAPQELPAYARLLLDAFEGDPILSIRADEAEECWRIVEPVLAAWDAGAAPLLEYPAGSGGPTAG